MAVTDEAIDRIRQMIVSGRLRPGDRLPREADLAAQLGLSRNSLREAVRALSVLNILTVRQGDGTYVSSLAPDVLMEAVAFVLDLHQDDTIMQAFQVRAILEPAATAMAAGRVDEDALAELHALLDRLGPAPSVEELVANDLEFHRRIAAASGVPLLCSLLDSISGPTVRARIWRGVTQQDAVARTVDEHRSILDALATHDAETARAWATVHIANVTRWLRAAGDPPAPAPRRPPAVRPARIGSDRSAAGRQP
ncbi:FadR/GntR family transcriptional regulator [Micromonospora mirobrigensis]|uniref:DNA-binding transcriptional regulator, FadR family n=1 Tax=Micromonospora mirobrigensis TaxID=262898 RepID=A0A1C4Z052_9ACTN|nr:FadR/GntR family transcriptional regulator [Micromonospora mirobrigensis]SCF25971.1 DNA-binding transcriptional regulator, FadR family [Micromonospora mirobrigensis]